MNPHRPPSNAPRGRPAAWRVVPLLGALVLAACAGDREVREARQLIAEGRTDEGLRRLQAAAGSPPRGAQAYASYVTQRDALVAAQVREAERLKSAGEFDLAEARYREALRLDPSSPLGQAGLDGLHKARAHAEAMAQAQAALQRGDLDASEAAVRRVLGDDSSHRGARALMKQLAERRAAAEAVPQKLRAALQRQVSIELRDAPLRTIFDILSRTGNINFVFDRDVRTDARASLLVRDTRLDDVLKVLMVTNQLAHKVLNDNSVLVYPATQAKQREYQELAMRSFYLANADVKQTAAMIRALVKTRDLFVDEKLNLIILRDTPEALRLAEQLVAAQDLGEPEVMLDLEVLEVASSLVQEVGLRFPEQIGVFGIDAAGNAPAQVNLNNLRVRPFAANPLLLMNLRQQDGATNLLANPRIRVRNREKAKVHIGERVPVITTTSTANVGVSSSVNYLETGLKLDVEPNIHLDDEVAIKVQLEVSNILEQLNVSGTIAYRLGTRNAATVLRLRDGETQVLAGLINSEERKSFAKLPYVGDVPLLGRLFRNDDERGNKTEIVLLITPRIVRNLERPATVPTQYAAGTEATPGSLPLRLSTAESRLGLSQAGGPAAGASPSAGAPPVAGAASTAAAASRASAAPVTMNVIAPAQATLGQEFAISLGLPTSNDPVTASVQLNFDPTLLAVVGAPPGAGSVTVEVAGAGIAGTTVTPTQVRLRVLAKAPTNTEIGIEVVNSNRTVQVPVNTHALSIVGQ